MDTKCLSAPSAEAQEAAPATETIAGGELQEDATLLLILVLIRGQEADLLQGNRIDGPMEAEKKAESQGATASPNQTQGTQASPLIHKQRNNS